MKQESGTTALSQSVKFDAALIRRYDVAGPRYTSYPTAVQFHEGFDAGQYRLYVAASNDELIPAPLSLYVHLPFCHSLCYYCGCNKKVTRKTSHGVDYLQRLEREIALQAALFDSDREVSQLHFGGGTPTFFDDEQLQHLMTGLQSGFSLDHSDQREFSIEIDPRTVDQGRLETLAGLGFNRISLGIQDIDPEVQKAVNRVQDPEMALQLVDQARQLGFNSVSIDLIYGLPKQTVASFERTIARTLQARPDRLAIYNYAHLPHVFRAQRMINEADLPSAETRLQLLELSISSLTSGGYRYIGMDHFALPGDELSQAQDNGKLQRNFQGYSTRPECDLVGLGVSAIGKIGDCYAQNLKEIPRWSAALDKPELPIWRGLSLGREDLLRRAIIEAIMCQGRIEFAAIENRFEIDFNDYFAVELHRLQRHQQDGLVEINEDELQVTPTGRLLLRHIAMAFDEYLPSHAGSQGRFSRVI
ncbi:MAG TPA: oxygen-independent coproporphyrinogen III oxidase [Xanthomonadales bacterium]|nr:oxygen-independent coproporphyrinogen III oxidase [Xanthomonadales bacterium]